jgi:Bacterial Ig-like domain (group 2)
MVGLQHFSFRSISIVLSLCALVLLSSCAGTPPSSTPTLRSITVIPANSTIATGTTQPFTATGNYSDSSTKNLTGSVSWQSQNTSAATITTGGMATAKAAGSSTIMATSGTVSGSTVLTVTSATLVSIAVTPANPSIAKGTTKQFTATGTFSDNSTQNLTGTATWSSQTTSVATIAAGGLATGVTAGMSQVQAASGAISGTTELTVTSATLVSVAVTPANPSIGKGKTEQFTATGTFSDNSTQNLTGSVTWSSATTGVVTITAGGLATGVATGMSKIEAASGAVDGTTELTVTAPTLVSIAVTPANPSIVKGTMEQFAATGTFSDNSTQNLTSTATWSSQTTSVATISAGGSATGVAAGTSKIQASSGAVSGSTTLTVTVTAPTLVSIAVTPASPSIVKGTTKQFTATGTFSDNSTQNLTGSATWTSQTTTVATIAAGGLATGVAAGTSKIQASSGAVIGSTTLTVTVTAPTLVSIAVTPASPSIGTSGTEQFTATGTFSDNSTQNLTSTATWTSQTTTVATIAAGGLATAVGTGMSKIQATSGGISGSTTLTVTSGSATLRVLVVSPQNPAIADSSVTQAFTATGHFSDGSTQNLTSSATWTSSSSGVATVSSAGVATSEGLASGVNAGYTSIQAVVGTIKGVSILSVTNHTSNSSGFAGVLTQHNDIGRTGQNLSETSLTPANVNTTTFGKKFSQSVDGYVYAQPLYVPNVTIGGSVHNVIYVATEGDSVYAFDADSNTGANAGLLWHVSMIDTAHGAAAGATTVNIQVQGGDFDDCTDLVPQVGITSTPVIDASKGTMYVEAKSEEGGKFIHRLHALDITTGAEKAPGPVAITATVPGNGDGGTTVSLDGLHHLNRPGLLLLNGMIYLAYASHCDTQDYHGWLFAYDAGTFAQTSLLVTTPNGGEGGFWMSGAGVAGDSNANIFIGSGNGDFDTAHIPAQELGDTVMKLFDSGTSTLTLLDYFTPWDQSNLDGEDNDVGAGGVMLLPDQPGATPHELVQLSKAGEVFLINRDQMTANNLHYCQTCTSDPQILGEFLQNSNGFWSAPAYFNGTVYSGAVGDSLKAFPLTNGSLASAPSETSSNSFSFPSPTPAVSANGSTNGIIWAIDSSQYGPPVATLGPAVLYAYRADTLAMLWNSSGASDTAGSAVKFAVPTIANGKVYIGTQKELDVYGTLP